MYAAPPFLVTGPIQFLVVGCMFFSGLLSSFEHRASHLTHCECVQC